MFYFKFTDNDGNKMYASVNIENVNKATPKQKEELIEELKNFIRAETLEEVSKEEYDNEGAVK